MAHVTNPYSSHPPRSSVSVDTESVPTALRSIGDQFTRAEIPASSDLGDIANDNTTAPDFYLPVASEYPNQIPTYSATWLPQTPRSDFDFRLTRKKLDVPARTVKSESNIVSKRNRSKPLIRARVLRIKEGFDDVLGRNATNLIERQYELVLASHTETMSLLAQLPDNLRAVLSQRVDNVFQQGHCSLYRLFRSGALSKLEEVYCAIQVMMTLVCMNREPETYNWNLLANGFSRMGRYIEDAQEQALYQPILKCVWQAQSTLPGNFWPQVLNHLSGHTETVDPESFNFLLSAGAEEVRAMLDNFDNFYILDNTTRIPLPRWNRWMFWHNAQNIEEKVFKPLRQGAGAGNLNIYTKGIQSELERGRLLNPREAEIRLRILVSEGIASIADRNFIMSRITTLFDTAMTKPNWRDRYYADSIMRFRAMSMEINSGRRASSKDMEQCADQLSSSIPRSSSHIASSSQTTATSSMRHRSKSQNLEPIASSQRTSIPVSKASSENSPTPVTDRSQCRECGRTFAPGRDQKGNFNRHWKKQHTESEPERCPFEGCDHQFSTKWNCERHIRDSHSNERASQNS